VIFDHWPELDLLDLDDFLFFAGFGRLLLRLVFVFAVIQDLADRRCRVGSYFDQVEPRGLRHLERGLDGCGAVVVTTGID